MQTFEEFGIHVGGKSGNVKMPCPKCSASRKNPKEPCLSVDTDTGLFKCHNCDFAGKAQVDGVFEPSMRRSTVYRKPNFLGGETNRADMFAYFERRGISEQTVRDLRVSVALKYLPDVGMEVDCLCFPYYEGNELVNVKYRGLETKSFIQEKNAKKVFFGSGFAGEEAVICEGEIDVLSFHEAGIASMSVPDGAIPENAQGTDLKFEYLQNCEAALSPLTKIIIATDNDGPGRALGRELARRLGEERCWRVEWPFSCKDANDVLLAYGPDALASLIVTSRPWPIDGLIEPIDVIDDWLALRKNPKKQGVTTGWASLDPFFKVLMPQVTIIGGTPNHGKSNYINQLAMNLVKLHGFGVVMACFEEGDPPEHYARIGTKHRGQAYWPSREGSVQTDADVIDACQFMQGHFYLLKLGFERRTLQAILEVAAQAVKRHGVRVVFIDPWNYVNHDRPAGQTETEEVSQAMSRLKDFAERYDCHVFLCAHPAKPIMAKVDGDLRQQVPHPYQISGSAHFFNKADNCLAIWRDLTANELGPAQVTVFIQKVRTQRVGKVGAVVLGYRHNAELLTDL